MPVVIIAGFLPMFLAAYAYREFNKVAPDCGTSFTWTTKAFGPFVGWIGGWAAILATVIVLSNLAGVAVQFFYQFLGNCWTPVTSARCGRTARSTSSPVWSSWPSPRRSPTAASRRPSACRSCWSPSSSSCCWMFAITALIKSGDSATGMSFDLDWFSPAGLTLSAFIAGLSGSIFAFWGWDTELDRQRGDQGRREDPRPCGSAVRRVHPADLPPRRRGHCRCTPGSAHRTRARQRGDLRQCLRCPLAA